jgi:hypothetical protein
MRGSESVLVDRSTGDSDRPAYVLSLERWLKSPKAFKELTKNKHSNNNDNSTDVLRAAAMVAM